jgi:hypothetical protein
MNRAEAKREACRRAATALRTAMDSGWPVWDEGAGTDEPKYGTEANGQRVADALLELIAELDRRGGRA